MQERDHLENEKIKILAKFCERRPATPRVERAESLQQVVDVVLERQLGEHTDRMSVAQSLLERGQVDNRGSLLRWGRRSGTRYRAGRLWRLRWSRCRRLRLRRLGPLGLGRFSRFRWLRRRRRLFRHLRRRLRRQRLRLLDGRGSGRSRLSGTRRWSSAPGWLRFHPSASACLSKDEQEACGEHPGAADRHRPLRFPFTQGVEYSMSELPAVARDAHRGGYLRPALPPESWDCSSTALRWTVLSLPISRSGSVSAPRSGAQAPKRGARPRRSAPPAW